MSENRDLTPVRSPADIKKLEAVMRNNKMSE